jgi:hypothetical protein
MKKLASTFCLLFWLTKLISQVLPCPSFAQSIELVGEISHKRTDDLLLPVVFHIIETNTSPSISNQEIENILSTLNNDFNNPINSPLQELDNAGIRQGKVGFKFKLAERDPNGNPTNGIIRKLTIVADIGNFLSKDKPSIVKSEEGGGADPWDVRNYINIWVAERNISLGATVAENTVSNDIEGIVLSFEAVKSFPKTASHEMGHYFGLLHPWGNTTGCDGEDDGIADTPFQEFPNFNCHSGVNCGMKFIPGNIMDFGPDDCLLYFTRLQAKYMQDFAYEYKENLIDSQDCFYDNFQSEFPIISINNGYENIEIYFENQSRISTAVLYDMSGKMICTVNVKGQDFLNIPTDGIPPAVYVLRFIGDSNEFAKKIIINR